MRILTNPAGRLKINLKELFLSSLLTFLSYFVNTNYDFNAMFARFLIRKEEIMKSHQTVSFKKFSINY